MLTRLAASLLASGLFLPGAAAHPSLYHRAEIDLADPARLSVHTIIHAPDLVTPTAEPQEPDWLENRSDAELHALNSAAIQLARGVLHLETARGSLERLARHEVDSPRLIRESGRTGASPDNCLTVTQSLRQPGGELAVHCSAASQKRLLLTVNRPGVFPEVHDLAPGESRIIALPPAPPSPFPWSLVLPGLLAAAAFIAIFRHRAAWLLAPALLPAQAAESPSVALNLPAARFGDHVLLTHARRDLVEAIRPTLGPDSVLVAPHPAREALEEAGAWWEGWWEQRFDYYQQQVTKRPVRSLPANRYVNDGDTLQVGAHTIRVLATPGYTRDAVTYLVDSPGQPRVAYTGDLLWAGGRVFDLYSFQDAIPEAQIGGYHGYGGRFADWIRSLERLQAEHPAKLIPARGPEITSPAGDIDRAIARVKALYASYLRTNALHWYFGEERMDRCATRVLGPDHGIRSMPLAENADLPPWCHHIGTTKLLVSDSGHGFVLDVGGPSALETLRRFLADGLLKGIEGIFVTHTHNDHTAAVRDAQRAFGCPVHALPEVAGVLTDPGRWFLPGISPRAVDDVTLQESGTVLEWREFRLGFHFYPGQMYPHGALLVERPGHAPVFFIGDSFSPSGMDDYCMMNRNLTRPGTGYELCFAKLRELPAGSWIVNQHIPRLFRFTPRELEFLEAGHRERRAIAAETIPWDDPDFALDEGWVLFEPYGQEVRPGSEADLALRIWNHSPRERVFTIRLHDHGSGIGLPGEPLALRLAAGANGTISCPVSLPPDLRAGVHVLTADLRSAPDIDVTHWCEALLKVVTP